MNIFIIICLSLITLVQILPFILPKPTPMPPINFANDFKALDFLIESTFTKMKFTYTLARQANAIRFTELDDMKVNLLESGTEMVMESLSPMYKKTLYKYMTEEAIIRFVSDTLDTKLKKLLLSAKALNKINKSDVTVKASDMK